VASALLHAALVVVVVTGSWRIDRHQRLITIIPPAPPRAVELPPFGGTRRGPGPSGGLGRSVPAAAVTDTEVPAPAPPVGKPDTTLAASPANVGPHIVIPPQMGDGRLWVLPRPALPGEVADALYGQPEHKDSVAVGRLRAMVDSLNVIIDQEQRARQKPTWTTEVSGKVVGIDSQYIHVAGIKIPTAALALLPIRLPEGNYDEQLRARHLEDMRQDLLQAARRTETLQLFRKYVRELRARKQAERDAEKRAKGDTTSGKADTVKVVP
jgi:hypothetical protein